MKKGCLIAVVAAVVIVLGCFVWVKNTYNGFVSQQGVWMLLGRRWKTCINVVPT